MESCRLDGSTLEGGGQLIRLSVCLSALAAKPIYIYNIRKGRGGGGGLKPQHLASIAWLATACDAEVSGLRLKSSELQFFPGQGKCGGRWEHDYLENLDQNRKTPAYATRIELQTPGAITLNLQALLPYLLLTGCELDGKRQIDAAKSNSSVPLEDEFHELSLSSSVTESSRAAPILLTLVGGTNVSNSPSIDYVQHVLLPNLEVLGLPRIEIRRQGTDQSKCLHRGWSSPGRVQLGSATLVIPPLAAGSTIPALAVPRRGYIVGVTAIILAPRGIHDYITKSATSKLREMNVKLAAKGILIQQTMPTINVTTEDSGDARLVSVLMIADVECKLRLGADCLWQGKMDDSVQSSLKAADRLIGEACDTIQGLLLSGRAIDPWMEDQLVVFQALASGRSSTSFPDRTEELLNANGVGSTNILCSPTLHTLTVRWVASELLGVDFDENGECEGVGYVAGHGIRNNSNPPAK